MDDGVNVDYLTDAMATANIYTYNAGDSGLMQEGQELRLRFVCTDPGTSDLIATRYTDAVGQRLLSTGLTAGGMNQINAYSGDIQNASISGDTCGNLTGWGVTLGSSVDSNYVDNVEAYAFVPWSDLMILDAEYNPASGKVKSFGNTGFGNTEFNNNLFNNGARQ